MQTQPTMRFHGSVAAMTEEVGKLTREGKRVMFAVSSTGEVERLADVFNEYNLSFRIGSRTPKPGQEVYRGRVHLLHRRCGRHHDREGLRARGSRVARGEPHPVRIARPVRRAGSFARTSATAEVEGVGVPLRLPRSGCRRLRGARRARHWAVSGAERSSAGRRVGCRVHGAGVRRRRAAVCAAYAARPGAEVSLVGGREAGAEPAGHGAVAEDQGAREEGHEGHGRRTAQALRRAQDRARATPSPPTASGSASSKTPSSSAKPKTR